MTTRRILLALLCLLALATSAGASTGWYLMAPPFTNRTGEPVVDTAQPLRRWFQRGAFDSAKTCTEAYEAEWRRAHSLAAPAPPATRNQVNESLCIASDDLRLGGLEGAGVLWQTFPAFTPSEPPVPMEECTTVAECRNAAMDANAGVARLKGVTKYLCLPDTVKP
jgi:hypothetical protein